MLISGIPQSSTISWPLPRVTSLLEDEIVMAGEDPVDIMVHDVVDQLHALPHRNHIRINSGH